MLIATCSGPSAPRSRPTGPNTTVAAARTDLLEDAFRTRARGPSTPDVRRLRRQEAPYPFQCRGRGSGSSRPRRSRARREAARRRWAASRAVPRAAGKRSAVRNAGRWSATSTRKPAAAANQASGRAVLARSADPGGAAAGWSTSTNTFRSPAWAHEDRRSRSAADAAGSNAASPASRPDPSTTVTEPGLLSSRRYAIANGASPRSSSPTAGPGRGRVGRHRLDQDVHLAVAAEAQAPHGVLVVAGRVVPQPRVAPQARSRAGRSGGRPPPGSRR